MNFRFFPDPDGRPQIWNHALSEAEVIYAFRRRVEDRPAREDSRSAIGRTQSGAWIRVIYVLDRDGRAVFVITAYRVEGKPLQALRARLRKRGQ